MGRLQQFVWGGTFLLLVSGNLVNGDTVSYTAANKLLLGPANGQAPLNAHAGSPLSWGDFDQDGKSDFLVSAPGYDTTENVGLVYLIRGSSVYPNPSALDTIAESVVGIVPFHQLGDALDGKGDINGDGKDDAIIGSPLKDQIFIIFGSNSAWGTRTPITQLAQTVASGQTVQFGKSISHGGDVNGDGIDDLLVGAPAASVSGSDRRGKAFLYLGRSDWTGISDASDADTVFLGVSDNDQAGLSVTILPDINGDGLDDIAISSAAHANQTGRVYLFFGRPTWSASYLLSQADAILTGENTGDQFGTIVQTIQDFNGDHIGDFAVSAPGYGAANTGAIYVYFGRTNGSNITLTSRIVGTESSEELGHPSYAGDINRDGLGDLLIGSPHFGQNIGHAYVFRGQATLSGTLTTSQADTEITAADSNQTQIGLGVSTAGDISETGVDAWLVGAPFFMSAQDAAGRVGVFVSATNTLPTTITNIRVLSGSATVTETPLHTDVVLDATANDPDATARNVLLLNLTVNSQTRKVRLYETNASSGRYQATIRFERSADQPALGRYEGRPSQNVAIAAPDGSRSATFTLSPSSPQVSELTITQSGTGTGTLMRVDYVLTDLDQSSCSVASGDLQFATYNAGETPDWQSAAVTGSASTLFSSPGGVSHNANFQPLYWEAGTRQGTFLIRLRVRDADAIGSYVSSNAFTVDNTVPTAPVLSTPDIKNTFEITITGNAEPLATATIYVLGEAVATGAVSAEGLLSVSGIPVSATRNTIVATVTDAVGLVSPTSNTITLTFGNTQQVLQSGSLTVTVNMPLGAAPSDDPLALVFVSTANLQTQLGDPPQYYTYLAGFNLGFTSQLEQTVTFSAGVATVNLHGDTLALRTDATIYYWNGSAWAQTGITSAQTSSTDITFSTTHFSRFMVAQLVDGTEPTVGPILINGVQIATNNYYVPTPTITATLADTESGIASWSIQLIDLDTNTVVTQNSAAVSQNQVTITFPFLTPLSDGRYQVRLSAQNHSIHTTTVLSGPFYIQTTAFSFEILAGPNPVRNDQSQLTIGYSLSQDADIDLILFDLRGRQLHRWKYSRSETEGQAGYHRLYWDLTDPFGDTAVNGLYQLYAVAYRDGNTIRRKLRIALLR